MLLSEMEAGIAKHGNEPEAWAPIAAHLITLVEHIPLGWGTHDELVTFYIDNEFHAWNKYPSDGIAARYHITLLKAEEIVDILKPYDKLRSYT